MAIINYDWHDQIYYLGACPEGLEFIRPFAEYEDAWQCCPHGNWLLWLQARMFVDEALSVRKQVLATAVTCVQQALPYALDSTASLGLAAISVWILETTPKMSQMGVADLDVSLAAAAAAKNWAAWNVVNAVEALMNYAYTFDPNPVCDGVGFAYTAIKLATHAEPSPSFASIVRSVFPKPPGLPGTSEYWS